MVDPEKPRKSVSEIPRTKTMPGIRLPLSDFMVSFTWVFLGAISRLYVFKILGLGHGLKGELAKGSLTVLNAFLCAWLGKITHGGSYNPLNLLPGAISGNFSYFLFTVGARIPFQVFGSIAAAKLVIETFPLASYGPSVNVEYHLGALIEGLLSFTIVMIYLEASNICPNDLFMKTWITNVCKVALHVLGSDLTGGVMNPASTMGWAYMQGNLLTKEQLLVYCLAPVEATLLAVWIFGLFVKPRKQEDRIKTKQKSE